MKRNIKATSSRLPSELHGSTLQPAKENYRRSKAHRDSVELKYSILLNMDFISLLVPFFLLKFVIKLKHPNPNSFIIRRLFHATLHHHPH